jgi:hypothetical protein
MPCTGNDVRTARLGHTVRTGPNGISMCTTYRAAIRTALASSTGGNSHATVPNRDGSRQQPGLLQAMRAPNLTFRNATEENVLL